MDKITYALPTPETAQFIVEVLAPNWTITPEGREVSLRADGAAVAYLRDLPEDYDGHIDADGVMWIGGTGYPPQEG
jgi:hypothetical protein